MLKDNRIRMIISANYSTKKVIPSRCFILRKNSEEESVLLLRLN